MVYMSYRALWRMSYDDGDGDALVHHATVLTNGRVGKKRGKWCSGRSVMNSVEKAVTGKRLVGREVMEAAYEM
jgi:hypothetical protein